MTKTKGAAPRRSLLATELLLIAALYNYAGLMPETFGGRPLLLAAAALSVSACADTPTSVICGALCGALADIFSSGGIGFYAIALSLYFQAEESVFTQSHFRFADTRFPSF